MDTVFSQKAQKTLNFFKGTARNAITSKDSQPKGNATSVTIDFEIMKAEALLGVTNLIPSSVVVGCDEPVPGLRDNFLPNTKTPADINLVEMKDLYIERVAIDLSPDIQRAVKEDCRRFRAEKYEAMKGRVADVYVQEVKLFVYFHNGWTAVNREGYRNYIVMRRVNDENYEYNGTFPVYDVFIHELSCLIFQVEFTVKIPLENSIEESMKVVLGWKPIFIDKEQIGRTTTIDKDMTLGPGKTLNFETLFELPGKTTDTRAKLRLDLNLTSVMNKSQLSQGPPRNIVTSTMPGDNPEFNRLKDKLKGTRNENEELRKQNEDLATLLQNKNDKEKERSSSPTERKTGAPPPQYVPVPQGGGGGYSPEYERQFLNKFDQLLNSINDIKNKQTGPSPLPLLPPNNQWGASSSTFPQNPPNNQAAWSGQSYQNNTSPAPVDYDARAREARDRAGQPRYQNDTISRVDQAGYVGAGIQGLIDPNYGNDPSLTGVNLRSELDDTRKITTITIQFLGIKYIPPPSDPAMVNFRIPERVFLTFDFFTYPTFRTKSLIYLNVNPEEIKSLPGNFANKQLPLVNEDFLKGGGNVKEPLYVFEINPLKEGSIGIHDALVNYLATKELAIDVWDGDSLMHFGKARIRLVKVLRQGKDAEVYTPTLEIIDEEKKEIKGVLQLSIKNQALVMDMRPESCPPEVLSFYSNRSNRSGKYKVKSFKPMDIQKELASGFDGSKIVSEAELQDEEHRKRLRIDRFKVMRSQLPAGPATDPNAMDMQAFNQSLREVEAIRERKKPEVISNALAKGFSDEHPIGAIFGHPKFITYKFENAVPLRSDFRLKINYANNAKPEEFNIVRQPRNWEALVNRLRCERPPEWGMLETTDVFTLGGGDSLTMIFKFLSVDESALGLNKPIDKMVSVSILDMKGQIICGIAFNFRLRHPIVDRTLTFYDLENRIASLELPPFFQGPNNRDR